MHQLKQWAFSAAQNGDLQIAKEAIVGDNVTQITTAIDKFNELKNKHEEDMQMAQQQLEQAKLQNRLAEIQAQGEEDRKTEELKYYYEMQLKNIDVNLDLLRPDIDEVGNERNRLQEQYNVSKDKIAQQKLDLERQKIQIDSFNKAAERQLKREDMDNKLKIARENKNRYDK